MSKKPKTCWLCGYPLHPNWGLFMFVLPDGSQQLVHLECWHKWEKNRELDDLLKKEDD
jgi:hypothetical protein